MASPEWADKPYGFANFLRAARFVNSLYNGRLLAKQTSSEGAFRYVTYRVRLSRRTETRDVRPGAATAQGRDPRRTSSGFVLPSQNEWIKAAYFDPSGGGTYSYWKYPTNPGVFGDGTATAPEPDHAQPDQRRRHQRRDAAAGDLPRLRSRRRRAGARRPSPPKPARPSTPSGSPRPPTPRLYQGSLGTVGQAKTPSPWGTLDQGGNAVEWTDTITPPPTGSSDGRVWRRLHGGIANAPAYQLWLSAVGLQPQDNALFTATYPWLGFRVGVVGDLKIASPERWSGAAGWRGGRRRSRRSSRRPRRRSGRRG